VKSDLLAKLFGRDHMAWRADILVVLIAAALPWSTSATAILLVVWILFLLPTLDLASVRREIATPAGGLPVLLAVLGVLGMLWADVSLSERLNGVDSFAKLLTIPLLLFEFRRSGRGLWVLTGFLVSCTALLVLSLAFVIWPALTWRWSRDFGVPVNDYIAQSGEFLICAFALAHVALDRFRTGRRILAIALLSLSVAFLLNIFYVATGRTALATIPVLFLLFALRHFGWKGMAGTVAAGILVGAVVWTSSPYLRGRVSSLQHEVQSYGTENKITSAGERLEFWKKSLNFVAEAPVIGHGTGSIAKMFRDARVGESGASAELAANPHNQTFAVAIQLGLLGVAVLFAMWLTHLLLFWRDGLIAWIGLVVVVQNVVGSLFNSHLFDFVQGWLYVLGVGVAGGTVLRASAPPREQASPP
jgi:O-antigen ligase